MVFWFFKNKSHEILKTEVEGIHNRLHTSFSNIKKDMDEISGWLSEHDYHKESLHKQFNSHSEIVQKRLYDLQKQIDSLFILFDDLKEQNELKITKNAKKIVEEPREQIVIQNSLPSLETLTQTQKQIFRAILARLTESGREWCSYKEIAEELYPGKDYHQVRPTISSYLNHIEALGLIKRKRKVKESYVSVTDYGQKVIKTLQQKKKINN